MPRRLLTISSSWSLALLVSLSWVSPSPSLISTSVSTRWSRWSEALLTWNRRSPRISRWCRWWGAGAWGLVRGCVDRLLWGVRLKREKNKVASAELLSEFDKRIPDDFADFEIFKLGYFSLTICCCCGGWGGGGRVLAIAAIHSPRSFKGIFISPWGSLFFMAKKIGKDSYKTVLWMYITVRTFVTPQGHI